MNYKICINDNLGYSDFKIEQSVDAAKKAGFDGLFTGWYPGHMEYFAKAISDGGLFLQSVHAPFHKMHLPWEEGEEGEAAIDELIACVKDTASINVPIVIIHPIIGMDKHQPSDLGITRFARLVKEAERYGVKLAFENVECIEYLEKIIAQLGNSPAVGYCWDTGHEMCYNSSMDVAALFGDKLICTHINDNLGQTNPSKVTWVDDAHLMPFDGIADWQDIGRRLARIKYSGEITLELTCNSKPTRDTHKIYQDLDVYGYMNLAYQKAQKLISYIKI